MNILTHHSSALGGAVVFRAVKESDEKLYIEISAKMIKEDLVLPMDWFVSLSVLRVQMSWQKILFQLGKVQSIEKF